MNILQIPSWFPTTKEPLKTTFVKELITGINSQPEIETYIYDWHEKNKFLTLKNPINAISQVIEYMNDKEEIVVKENMTWIQTPYLSRNPNIFGTTIKPLTRHGFKVLEMLKKQNIKIDLIHAHVCYPASVVAYHLAKALQVPYIVTEQIQFSAFTNRENRKMAYDEGKDGYNHAVVVVALSTKHKELIEQYTPNVRVVVLPNLVDEAIFTPNPSRKNKNFTFVSIGRLTDGKGFEDLLYAFKEVITSQPNTLLRIAGDGLLRSKLKSLSESLGLQNNVSFLGLIDRNRIAEEQRNADCFILPSHYESFGVVYIEALASGTPVIGALNGGAEDIVQQGFGILNEVGNVTQIKNSMLQMINNSHQYDPQVLRKYFMENFSIKAVSEKYLALYKEVLNKKD